MTLTLPNLDHKTYQELIDELVGAIPVYSKTWTNFNDSDPGITLLQLLAWIGETLLYRLNRIPQPTYTRFLALLAGATRAEIQTVLSQIQLENDDRDYIDLLEYLQAVEDGLDVSVEDLQQVVLTYLQEPFSTVTTPDFQTLAMQANRSIPAGKPTVARAVITHDDEAVTVWIVGSISNTGLSTAFFQPRFPNIPPIQTGAPTRLTIMGKPIQGEANAYANLLQYVTTYLQPRFLLGTLVRVEVPLFTPVDLEIELMCAGGIELKPVLEFIAAELIPWFGPVSGWNHGKGWPYGRAPRTNDIKSLVLAVAGVRYIRKLRLTFAPTVWLGNLAALGVNTLLQPAPAGLTRPQFQGLARLRLLDLKAYHL